MPELGVPCRVHPSKPHTIDVDWTRAYEEHGPAWDRLDALKKGYAQRAEGPLGKLLAPIEYFGARKPSTEEQAQIDREVENRIEREQRLRPEHQAIVDENEWVAAHGLEARRLLSEGRRATATVTALSVPPPGSVVYTLTLDVEGVGEVEHRQALNERWAASLGPGSRTDVMIDPADPTRMTLA